MKRQYAGQLCALPGGEAGRERQCHRQSAGELTKYIFILFYINPSFRFSSVAAKLDALKWSTGSRQTIRAGRKTLLAIVIRRASCANLKKH